MSLPAEQKAQLRQQLLSLRTDLSLAERQQAEKNIASYILTNESWQNAKKIATFASIKGEVNLSFINGMAWQQKKQLYLPILSQQKLLFAPYEQDGKVELNQYGIMEPSVAEDQHMTADQLDLILVPLVGFDIHGNRLGMGKGYFDAALAPLMKLPQRPLLMGVAFACQQVSELPIEEWDVPLDMIVTEEGVIQRRLD